MSTARSRPPGGAAPGEGVVARARAPRSRSCGPQQRCSPPEASGRPACPTSPSGGADGAGDLLLLRQPRRDRRSALLEYVAWPSPPPSPPRQRRPGSPAERSAGPRRASTSNGSSPGPYDLWFVAGMAEADSRRHRRSPAGRGPGDGRWPAGRRGLGQDGELRHDRPGPRRRRGRARSTGRCSTTIDGARSTPARSPTWRSGRYDPERSAAWSSSTLSGSRRIARS